MPKAIPSYHANWLSDMASFGIRRLGYALGAEISGLDLSKPLDDGTFAELRRAWYEHIVLCIPGQELEPAKFAAFAGLFGELDDGSAEARSNARVKRSPSGRSSTNRSPAVPRRASGSVVSGTRTDRTRRGRRWRHS